MGSVALRQHQLDGVRRLNALLERYRGALLADEVGLGKTYTALAVARGFARVEIVAPTALRAMWNEACARCDIPAQYVTAESLSRSAAVESDADLIIVDEAHWFRNAATRRYRHLARRYRRAAMLLLSATPLHNRPADVAALCALFLGPRASRLAPNDVAALTVRRGRSDIASDRSFAPQTPSVRATHWWRVSVDLRLLSAVDGIEPPVPLRDGELAMGLLRLTLVRRLSSSHAALRATLKRMLSRALALFDAASAGRYPTARELRAWLVADDALQLAFPEFLVNAAEPNAMASLVSIERHIASLRAALAALDAAPDTDAARASALLCLMQRYSQARIVAFSQYEATVRALASALRRTAGIAVLSAKGGRIASGGISRAEVLRQFDATDARSTSVNDAMRIRLLLTTDLLSEGVNLHNAQVVVHLDVPWTAARLEQRVGRLSRIGSPHEKIHVFGFAPPAELERLHRTVARLRVKWAAAQRRMGQSPLLAHDALLLSGRGPQQASGYTQDFEALRRILTTWLGDRSPDVGGSVIACVRADSGRSPSVLALLRGPAGPQVIAYSGQNAVSTHPRVILRVARRLAFAPDRPPDKGAITDATSRLTRYLAHRKGQDASGSLTGTGHAIVAAFHSCVTQSVAQLPRSVRPQALRVAASLRRMLDKARSAGDYGLVVECCGRLMQNAANTHPLQWLERAQVEFAAHFKEADGAQGRAESSSWRIDAVLIGV